MKTGAAPGFLVFRAGPVYGFTRRALLLGRRLRPGRSEERILHWIVGLSRSTELG